MMRLGAYTRLRSDRPTGKAFSLVDGALEKRTIGQFVSGSFRVVEFADVHELVEQFATLEPCEVVTASLPVNGVTEGRIVTRAALPANPGALTRTKDKFKFADRAGLLTIDCDPPKGGMSAPIQI